ncbi:Swt1 family HEPN domain-containing protein [Hanstruepera ponticola]|uniref:Swt1 family HEPN domain-containing protein n=1 Tax=Hanstruepera ponticola TaxID=2042995 RepID=UPI00177BBE56|nr:Swt1 family HEPN domain-containing protein [Hanstruepera ponticola]
MQEKFKEWVVQEEDKAEGTASSYANALNKISEHYSKFYGKWIDLFTIQDIEYIDKLISLYDFDGKYSDYGNKGNRTYINGLKTFKRFILNKPKIRGSRSKSQGSNSESPNSLIFSNFNDELQQEAKKMKFSYELFYCLERSIRELVKSTMAEVYGNDWWSKVDFRVRENVKNNLKYELDTTHTKRSEHRIDYTTFGDLRKIINSNWTVFEMKFKRSLNSVNEVMIDLNRIRVSIAHCTPLAQKEINRLEIRVDDWFSLMKNY